MKQNEVLEGFSFKEHRKHPGVSQSDLKVLKACDCLAEFKYKLDHPERRDNRGMLMGRIFDALVCECSDPRGFPFSDSFIVLSANSEKPTWNKKPENYTAKEKAYKHLESEAAKRNLEIISEEMLFEGKAQVQAIKEGWYSEYFDTLIKKGTFQATLLGFDEQFQIQLKGRPDTWVKDGGLIVDFKTTSDSISELGFGETVFKYNYHIQAAFYKRLLDILGLPFTGFCFFVIKNSPPYSHRIFDVPSIVIEMGDKEIDRLLGIYSKAMKNDEWPGFYEISEFRVPRRFLNNNESEGEK